MGTEVVNEVDVERRRRLGSLMMVSQLSDKPSVRVCRHPDAVILPLGTAAPANHLIAGGERSMRVGLT